MPNPFDWDDEPIGGDSCWRQEPTDCFDLAVAFGVPNVEVCQMTQIWMSCDADAEPDVCEVDVEADGVRLGGDCDDIIEIAQFWWDLEMPGDEPIGGDTCWRQEDMDCFDHAV